jgi:hypothetical protein
MCLLVLALETVSVVTENLLTTLLDYGMVECRAAAHSKLVPRSVSHIFLAPRFTSNSLLVLLELLLAKRVKRLQCELEVSNQRVAS